MASAEWHVEVAYAAPQEQSVVALTLPAGSTVGEAITRSGLLARFPEIDLGQNRVGVFGVLADLNDRLEDGARVEIYRPLIANPKEVRRQRAAAQRKPR
jgi:hypothetical protein